MRWPKRAAHISESIERHQPLKHSESSGNDRQWAPKLRKEDLTMKKNVVIDIETIDRLKREAKKIKKETGHTHTECLEIVAQKYGWPTWHAVTLSCQPYREAISHWENGIVVMFEVSDTESIVGDLLIQNDILLNVALPTLKENLSETGPISDEELDDVMGDYWMIPFALTNCTIPTNVDIDWLHDTLKKDSFFMPLAVFWKTKPVFEASQLLCSKDHPLPSVYTW